MITRSDAEQREWRYRREAATLRAERVGMQARRVCEQMVLLSQCETDHEAVLRALQDLLEELLLAQQLTLDFDCAARHEAETPDRG